MTGMVKRRSGKGTGRGNGLRGPGKATLAKAEEDRRSLFNMLPEPFQIGDVARALRLAERRPQESHQVVARWQRWGFTIALDPRPGRSWLDGRQPRQWAKATHWHVQCRSETCGQSYAQEIGPVSDSPSPSGRPAQCGPCGSAFITVTGRVQRGIWQANPGFQLPSETDPEPELGEG